MLPGFAGSTTTRCRHHNLSLCEREDPQRDELERFVRTVFSEHHGACVQSFMPTMLVMRNDSGRICSVVGFRAAAEESLFLERYLAVPIERAIASNVGHEVSRSQIVEVGNLSGVNCRAALRLVLALPRLLLERGQRWIAFTATSNVRKMLGLYGAPLIELATADASRLGGSADEWGRYYQTDPRVMVGYLPQGIGLARSVRGRA
jgi:hypothetical protein